MRSKTLENITYWKGLEGVACSGGGNLPIWESIYIAPTPFLVLHSASITSRIGALWNLVCHHNWYRDVMMPPLSWEFFLSGQGRWKGSVCLIGEMEQRRFLGGKWVDQCHMICVYQALLVLNSAVLPQLVQYSSLVLRLILGITVNIKLFKETLTWPWLSLSFLPKLYMDCVSPKGL